MKNNSIQLLILAGFFAATAVALEDFYDATGYYDTFGAVPQKAATSAFTSEYDTTGMFFSGGRNYPFRDTFGDIETGKSCTRYMGMQDGVLWSWSVVDDDPQHALIGADTKSRAVSSLTEGTVIIPPEIDGLPVVGIDRWAFNGCSKITSIAIPITVTSIGWMAFSGCSSLKETFMYSPTQTAFLNANGGSVSTNAIIYRFGDASDVLPTPVRNGWLFAGWSLSPDGMIAYADGMLVKDCFASLQDESVTLYAQWSKARYSIAFDANGGAGSMGDVYRYSGVKQTLPGCTFTKDGHFLLGWALTPDGEATLLDGDSTVDIVAAPGETVTLYAVWHEGTGGKYLILDLGAGSSAEEYPVSFRNAPPVDGFNTDEYKTTKLVLRRIEAGSYIMGADQSDESHRVTLTKPFFIGLFEVTQKQWSLVMGSNPSNFSGDKRPVEKVSYNAIRGSSSGAQWPSSSAVDASSFLGKLRARTGLDFDLPTEAQWEYACRAGTTTTYSYGDSANGNYMWYSSNSSSQTHEVGTKQPNPWGLYDMHGNVWEWCLDWYGTLAYGTDPKGSSSGSLRVRRGGSWYYNASICASFYRKYGDPSDGDSSGFYGDSSGFRLSSALTPFTSAYAVRFDANGGEGTMAKRVYAAGDDVTLPTQAFVRDGWTFVGWATEPDGAVAYGDGETIEGGIDVANCEAVTLYARWAQSQYAVHFNANGGEGTMADESFWLGIPGWLSSNAFTRTGYDFAGWATAADGVVEFADKALVTNMTEEANATADLYAIWSPHQYEVRFNRGTGTGSMPNRQLTYDIAANLTSNAFMRTGYTFAGWATEADGEAAYADGAVVFNLAAKAGSVIDLYATWASNNYAVRFDANGGEGTMADLPFSYDEAAALSASAFTRANHFFAGWATTPDGAVAYADGEVVSNLTTEANGEVRLYAVWADSRVVFDANGGEGSMRSFFVFSGTEQPLPQGTFTKDGCFLLGWARTPDGEATLLDGDTTADLAAQAGETVTLYAVWHEGEGGGNGLSVKYYDISSSGYSTWTQSEAAMTNYFASKTPTIVTNTLAFGKTLQSGFQQNGDTSWYFSEYSGLWLDQCSTNRYHGKYANQSQEHFAMLYEGSIRVDAGGEYTFGTSCDDVIVIYIDGNRICATSAWTSPSKGTIALEPGSHRIAIATYENGGSQGMFVEWKKPGDTSFSPLPQSVLTDGMVTTYAVAFDANGGAGTMAKLVYALGDDVTLPANLFVRDGLTFLGWATEADGPVAYADGETIDGGLDATNGETTTLYARWGKDTYTVHFDANGGEGTMVDKSFWIGIPDRLSSNVFTRVGYTFAGWATAADGEAEYADKALVTNLDETVGATVNLYAVWSPNHYLVRFNSGSGTGSMPNQTITYNAATALPSNAFTRVGYMFAGWATEADGAKVYDDGEVVLNLSSTNNAVVDLYATWAPNSYSVVFDANGGEGTMAPQQFTYDEGQSLTANAFTRASRFFAGWATEADGAVAYADGAVVSNLTAAADGEVRLYAVWADSRVIFDANGGEGEMEPFFLFAGTEQTLPEGTFTKDGHFLLGWALTPDGEATLLDGDSTADIGAAQGETVTLYAVWHEGRGGKYLILDLGAGISAEAYPVSFRNVPPVDGFNTDEYKTTKLVLKRIEAGSFIMGGGSDESHRVTLTKPFYCGLFEVTQKQWSLVMGSNPSSFSGDKRPVEMVSYNAIRGSSAGAGWPSSSAVDASSFMGRLMARTGMGFDLPTEAQWEYACLAGTTTDYNNGTSYGGNSSNDPNLNLLGRYYFNRSDGKGGCTDAHTVVGSYQPNAWGLYDMHGNVLEWCLDWYGALAYGVDPKGSSSGSNRMQRGGGWCSNADNCASFIRGSSGPSSASYYRGFRLSSALTPFTSSYAVRFDANGGEGTMAKHVYAAGDDVALPLMAFVRDGWTFVGWATEPDGAVAYADGETIEGGIDVANCEAVTLYARWAEEAEIRFNANGGAGSMAGQSFPIGYPFDLAVNGFSRVGYSFAGWSTESGGHVAYTDGETVTIDAEKGDAVDLFAVWTPNGYEVSFDPTEGAFAGATPTVDVVFDSPYGRLPVASRTGYTLGWTLGGEAVTAETICATPSNHVLTASWTPNEYTVAFDANGGTVSPGTKTVVFDAAYGALPAPAFEWHSLKNWMLDGEAVTPGTIVATPSNHTLVADWNLAIGGGVWEYPDGDGPITLEAPLVAPSGEVVIPEEIDGRPIVAIEAAAFASNTAITSISIPASVTNIGKVTAYVPGLLQAKFNSRFDITSTAGDADEAEVAVVSGTIAAYTQCDEYITSFSDPLSGHVFKWNKTNSTFAYFGQMWMDAGKTYVFGAHFDDDAYVKVDGQELVNVKDSSQYSVYTGRYECRESGWHDVEFRVSDQGGGKGPWGYYWNDNFGFGYRDDGRTDCDETQSGWKRLIDPGDGSLFRCVEQNTVYRAFAGCTGIECVALPRLYADSMLGMFPDAGASLKEVIFLDGIEEIPDNFFDGCTALLSMDIPESVVEIGTNVFEACSALDTTTVDGLKVYQGWVLGVADGAAAPVDLVVPEEYEDMGGSGSRPYQIRGIAAGAFRDEYDIETISLPESLQFIGASAFRTCTSLEEIALPDGIWKIDRDAFRDCTWASELLAPTSLRVVGDGAFENCASLQTAVFEDGLESIGADAFKGDWRMLSVSLPHSVTNIAPSAFTECDGLRGVAVPATVATMSALFPDAYDKIETAAVAADETEIMDGMFAGCQKLADFTWAGSETNVGERAFLGCRALTSLAMPDSVIEVGVSAFEGCSSISDVTLSRSLGALPARVFFGCSSLDSFVVPASVVSLGSEIVRNSAVSSIYYLGNAPAYVDGTYSGISAAGITTYVVEGTRGWDGTPTSRVLPRLWLGFPITPWTPNRFDVTFDANGGYFGNSSVTQWAEQQITDTGYALPNQDPLRYGYAFEGWWTEPSAGAQVRYSTRVTATRPHTIYAHWRSLGTLVTATFNSNGGTAVVPGSQQYIAGQTFGAFPVPSRRGYSFDGWWTAASGGTRVTEASKVPSADMELFAHWVAVKYYVSFDSNGGTGSMPDQEHIYDTRKALSGNRFARDGFAFTGWARSPGGQVAYADGTAVVNLAETQGAVVTLYAAWSGVGYNVRFDSNGGYGIMDNQTIAIGETRNLNANIFVWPGREFLGWATTSGGAVLYRDGDAVRNLANAGATVSLYAVWSATDSTWSVTFDANGGSVSPLQWSVSRGETLYALPLPTRPGFTFDGWWTQATGGTAVNAPLDVTSDMTLFAHWTDNVELQPYPVKIYTVTFNANGGIGTMAAQTFNCDKVAALRKNSFTRGGYVFVGWAKSKAGAVAYANGASVKNLAAAGKSITLYAQWAVAAYKVAYNANGGTLPKGKKMAAQKMVYGKAAKLTKNVFTRKGYVFAGWAKSKADAKKGVIAFANAAAVKNLSAKGGTVTLYAVWAKPTYKVAFYANGGTGKTVVQAFKYGKAAKLAACKFKAPKGRKFAGWATSAANAKKGVVKFKNKQAVKNLIITGKTVKLYAVWKK